MRDRVHQPWREGLVSFCCGHTINNETFSQAKSLQIPGLANILSSMTPATHPGLLGVCLSGAGPTILALVLKDSAPTIETDVSSITTLAAGVPVQQRIGEAIQDIWRSTGGIEVKWIALEVDEEGATCVEL